MNNVSVTMLTIVTPTLPPCWRYSCCSGVASKTCVCLCVELHASRNARSANNLGESMVRFPQLTQCVRIKYTSNMAACYANDVTAPRVYARKFAREFCATFLEYNAAQIVIKTIV